MRTFSTKEQKFLAYVTYLYASQYEEIDRESSRSVNTVTATNQLRYASRHIIEAMGTPKNKKRIAELQRALHHLWRAKYDLEEATVITHLQATRNYIKWVDRDEDIVNAIIPTYSELRKKCETVFSRLSTRSKLKKKSKQYRSITQELIESCFRFRDLIESNRTKIAKAKRNRAICSRLRIGWEIVCAITIPILVYIFSPSS